MMLVLDNCEHVIDAVASLVVAIMNAARGVHILATSREPLRVQGEHVFRLEPLETPPASERLDAADGLWFPAVRLFVDRMAASHEGFELRDEDASLVGEICRKLDGIPLAIELAAARVDLLGVRELAARLEDGLQVLKGGRRTVLPRHQTVRATLDWSYGLLSPPEQIVFSRLAIFAGGFTLAAAAVVGDADLGGEEVVDLVLEVATKSLVAADGNFLEPRFRLLATTRAYAFEKARERAELDTLAQRHATYFLTLFDSASRVDAEFDKASAALALEINNLRAALAWAFAPPGDLAVGIGLAAASVPLWVSTSMLGEWHVWAERAINSLDKARLRGTRQEMTIRATQGMSFQLVRNRASEAYAALTWALELAELFATLTISFASSIPSGSTTCAWARCGPRSRSLIEPTRSPPRCEIPSRRRRQSRCSGLRCTGPASMSPRAGASNACCRSLPPFHGAISFSTPASICTSWLATFWPALSGFRATLTAR
jgi:predicted ATPase